MLQHLKLCNIQKGCINDKSESDSAARCHLSSDMNASFLYCFFKHFYNLVYMTFMTTTEKSVLNERKHFVNTFGQNSTEPK